MMVRHYPFTGHSGVEPAFLNRHQKSKMRDPQLKVFPASTKTRVQISAAKLDGSQQSALGIQHLLSPVAT